MSISDEIHDWLADEIPAHVERIRFISRLSERRATYSHHGRLPIPRGERENRYVELDECTPDDLREIADAHDAAAAELSSDADELRQYADHLHASAEDSFGGRLADHLRVMRNERQRREGQSEEDDRIARSAGGVIAMFRDDYEIGVALRRGGILTVEELSTALFEGRVHKVKGIGPARLAQITQELARLDGDGTGS